MNRLSRAERATIIRCLVEGNSIRSTSRMTGAARNTITTLLVELGRACAEYQDVTLRDLPSTRIECDEIWSFVYAKARGHVEVDETFIGGKARNMHLTARRQRITGTGGVDKVAVVGILERGGRIWTQIVPDRKRHTLQALVRENVEHGSNIYTDALGSYVGLDGHDYTHRVVDHAKDYVDGIVHTNGVENFWSLLKRGLKGTYVSVEPFHLFRYLDERAFAFNERDRRDLGRFMLVLLQGIGRRVTWAELTGKSLQASEVEAI